LESSCACRAIAAAEEAVISPPRKGAMAHANVANDLRQTTQPDTFPASVLARGSRGTVDPRPRHRRVQCAVEGGDGCRRTEEPYGAESERHGECGGFCLSSVPYRRTP